LQLLAACFIFSLGVLDLLYLLQAAVGSA